MYSARDSAALPTLGFPIRESTGQRLFSASPWLIAAVHALHRLLVPRHPPYALTILTVINPPARAAGSVIPNYFGQLCSFQGPRGAQTMASSGPVRTGGGDHGWSLKTQQHVEPPESALQSRLGRHARTRRHSSRRRKGSGGWIDGLPSEKLPRKEVIQPQLPLRLPCYDFTPITSPTFDGSLPDGLGHRLRVLPAFVV
jgi:hypothetical protein